MWLPRKYRAISLSHKVINISEGTSVWIADAYFQKLEEIMFLRPIPVMKVCQLRFMQTRSDDNPVRIASTPR